MELSLLIPSALSLVALYFAWRAWKIAQNANEISKRSNQLAENSNQIAIDAKNISEKFFKIEKQKMEGEISQEESDQR